MKGEKKNHALLNIFFSSRRGLNKTLRPEFMRQGKQDIVRWGTHGLFGVFFLEANLTFHNGSTFPMH